MKTILVAFLMMALIGLLQNRLWRGDGGIEQFQDYTRKLEVLKKDVQESQDRNAALYAEVLNLRQGTEAIEERARNDLGMISPDQTFFQFLD